MTTSKVHLPGGLAKKLKKSTSDKNKNFLFRKKFLARFLEALPSNFSDLITYDEKSKPIIPKGPKPYQSLFVLALNAFNVSKDSVVWKLPFLPPLDIIINKNLPIEHVWVKPPGKLTQLISKAIVAKLDAEPIRHHLYLLSELLAYHYNLSFFLFAKNLKMPAVVLLHGPEGLPIKGFLKQFIRLEASNTPLAPLLNREKLEMTIIPYQYLLIDVIDHFKYHPQYKIS